MFTDPFTTTAWNSSIIKQQILTLDCLFPSVDRFLTPRCTILLLLLRELVLLLRSSRPPFCLKSAVKEIPLNFGFAGTKHGPIWRTKQRQGEKNMTVFVQRLGLSRFFLNVKSIV